MSVSNQVAELTSNCMVHRPTDQVLTVDAFRREQVQHGILMLVADARLGLVGLRLLELVLSVLLLGLLLVRRLGRRLL